MYISELYIFPDLHSDEELAQDKQRYIELLRPDALVLESGPADEGSRRIAEEYRTFGDIYDSLFDNTESLDGYFQEVLGDSKDLYLNSPIYSLDVETIEHLTKPLNRINNELEDEENSIDEDFYHIGNYINSILENKKKDHPNSSIRLLDSANLMGAETSIAESNRKWVAEIAAERDNHLPDNTEENLKYFNSSKGTEKLKENPTRENYLKIKDIKEILNDPEIRQKRDMHIAEEIKEQYQEGNESVAVDIGANHVEGVVENMPDEVDITVVDLLGEEHQWSIHQDPEEFSIDEFIQKTGKTDMV